MSSRRRLTTATTHPGTLGQVSTTTTSTLASSTTTAPSVGGVELRNIRARDHAFDERTHNDNADEPTYDHLDSAGRHVRFEVGALRELLG